MVCIYWNRGDIMARKRLRLSSPSDVRKAMSKIANAVYNGEIDPKEANAILYACNSVLSSIRIDEQQKKIEELEQILNNQKL